MITINLIKDDPKVRRAVQMKRAQERFKGSPKALARFTRYRANHLEDCRAQDRAIKAAQRVRDPEKLNERNRIWRAENYELALEYVRHAGTKWRSTKGLMRKYGLTPEGLVDLLARQKGCCGICTKPLQGGHQQHIDHDHNKPGTARGVLCNKCNMAIGLLQDDPEILIRAAAYVRKGGV